MSSALARKKRSADIPPSTPNSGIQYNPSINSRPAVNTPSSKQAGLTLPQVISVIDNRLIALENYVKENKNNEQCSSKTVTFQTQEQYSQPTFIDEIESRFEILAKEFTELKDIVLRLQSYTLDVNKTLLEERIHLLSDLGDDNNNIKEDFTFQPQETETDL
jgi:hypothetical protein